MIDHFAVLGSIMPLLLGLWGSLYIYQQDRRSSDSRLHSLACYMFFLTVFSLYMFVFHYFSVNLSPFALRRYGGWLNEVDFVVYPLLLGMTQLYGIRTLDDWLEKKTPAWFTPALFTFIVILIILHRLVMQFPGTKSPGEVSRLFWNLLIWSLNGVNLIWLIHFTVLNRRLSDRRKRHAGVMLGLGFFIVIGSKLGHLGLSLLHWDTGFILFGKALGVFCVIWPVVWVHAYFLPWAGSMGRILTGRIDLTVLQQSHGISAREMEILRLIVDGRSYRQIESELFISIHTVKSHVYSLYRKMGVNSRHQLVHRISQLGDGA